MVLKLVLSLVLSALIIESIAYIRYQKQNKILSNINKSIFQSTIMYFSEKVVLENEMNKFNDFVMSRIADKRLDEWISNFSIQIQEADKLLVKYRFKRSDTQFQVVSFEVTKHEK